MRRISSFTETFFPKLADGIASRLSHTKVEHLQRQGDQCQYLRLDGG